MKDFRNWRTENDDDENEGENEGESEGRQKVEKWSLQTFHFISYSLGQMATRPVRPSMSPSNQNMPWQKSLCMLHVQQELGEKSKLSPYDEP